METVGNVMLLTSALVTLSTLSGCLFALFNSKGKNTQKSNIEVEALKNTCFKHIAEIEVRLKKLESEEKENANV